MKVKFHIFDKNKKSALNTIENNISSILSGSGDILEKKNKLQELSIFILHKI